MKLVAKVRFIHEKNAEHMIRAFFNEFDPRSSILIKGEVAELEIFFKDLPKEIIDSITHCGIMEFICAPHLCKDEEEENAETESTYESLQEEKTTDEVPKATEQISEEPENAEKASNGEPDPAESKEVTSIESELVDIEETTSVTPEPEKKEEENAKNVKEGKRKKCEVPELAEFAVKSESYEEFVKNVATWLNLGKNYQFFVKLAQNLTLPSYGTLHWKDCKYAVGKEEYSDSKKIACTTKVAAKFKGSENEVTILKLLEAIIEYRTFDFQKKPEQTSEPESTKVDANSTQETPFEENLIAGKFTEESSAEESTFVEESTESVAEVKPAEESSAEPNLVAGNPVEETTIMSDVLCFKEAVESVDKTQPIETRVKHVLTAMGVEKLEEKEQEYILEIASVAVVVKEGVDLDDILMLAKIPEEDTLNARMTFATFINNVVKEYAPGKQIKLVDFLKELQKGVRLEAEIENITE